jgi:hypothetical protein
MKKISIDPAFPIPGLHHDESFNGMSIRDYFAAKAMHSFLSDPKISYSYKRISEDAYVMADAMMFGQETDSQKIRRLMDEVESLNLDVIEQCRIIGMGTERELALLARIEHLEKLVMGNESAYQRGYMDGRAVQSTNPLTDTQIEKIRTEIFSTDNPYCPVDRKSMRKVAKAIEAAHNIKEQA